MRLPNLRYGIGAIALGTGALLVYVAYQLEPGKRIDVHIALLTLSSMQPQRGMLGVEGPMIRYDIDGSLAVRYYLVDRFLLDSFLQEKG